MSTKNKAAVDKVVDSPDFVEFFFFHSFFFSFETR
jgi:hypothetical protein